MDLRLFTAILAGKTISFITRLTGGGATAAPGLYALKIDPNLVKKLAVNLTRGSVIITGTNGKTTTSRLISSILEEKDKLIHNRQGSNLLRGIASTLVAGSSIKGKLSANLGIWEVDEATLQEVLNNITPKTVILLNLFRDQLDRYGEIESIRQKWQKALATLPKSVNLIVNADDPQLSFLASQLKAKTIFFGVDDTKINLPPIENVSDIRFCLSCGKKLSYSAQFTSHMGHYSCTSCGFKRPKAQIDAKNLVFNKNFSTNATFTSKNGEIKLKLPLPGLYNVYNVLAAVSLVQHFGVSSDTYRKKIEKFLAAFGRYQTIIKNEKKVIVFLIKNPTGANEVLRTLATHKDLNLLICLNDNIADGRDVSWIWDTAWEVLSNHVISIHISGTRRWDMATRIKYANINMNINHVHENINYSISEAISNMDNNNTLFILPTYTAMIKIQKLLTQDLETKWQKQ